MVDARRGSSRLRVLIAEDQYLTREGTRRLLEERDELEVTAGAGMVGRGQMTVHFKNEAVQ